MTSETIVIAVVVAAAVYVSATRLARPWGAVVSLLCATAGVLLFLALSPSGPEAHIANRPLEIAGDGYVSSDTCKSCHPDQYSSWRASYHRTMTQVASEQSILPPFDQTLELQGREYKLERRGDEFWVEMDAPIRRRADGTLPRMEQQVVMTTGSHTMQLYWYATGQSRLVNLVPIVYMIAEDRWVPRHSVFLAPPVSGPNPGPRWNTTCIRCHSTHGRQRKSGDGEFDTHVAELGISCEACHGPGAEHVEANHSPYRRYEHHLSEVPDPTIVQPARLDANKSSQVCGQCHGVHYFYNAADIQDWNESGPRYRPGDELIETKLVVRHTPSLGGSEMRGIHAAYSQYNKLDRFWSDGMARVSGREYNGMIESPCVKGGEFSCLSCHTLHKPSDDPRSMKEWADDQLTLGMDGDEACLQCHDKFREDAKAHTFHEPGSTGSRCQNCHMPYTTYGLLKAIRSHQVDSPDVKTSINVGRPNACNQCHLNETLAWASEHLKEWYDIAEPPLTRDQKEIAASVLWTLRGEAGQRALMAWSMGWGPAREVSGTEWMVPYLAQALVDPYDAVRIIAWRSLRSLPGYADVDYGEFDDPALRTSATRAVLDLWEARPDPTTADGTDTLLLDGQGGLLAEPFARLRRGRDNRRIILKE